MRRMACHASLRFDGRVFVEIRTELIKVTLGADGILGGVQLHHLGLKRAVGIMAIVAFHQSFGDSVMERLLKCCMDVGVTLIAKRWLACLE